MRKARNLPLDYRPCGPNRLPPAWCLPVPLRRHANRPVPVPPRMARLAPRGVQARRQRPLPQRSVGSADHGTRCVCAVASLRPLLLALFCGWHAKRRQRRCVADAHVSNASPPPPPPPLPPPLSLPLSLALAQRASVGSLPHRSTRCEKTTQGGKRGRGQTVANFSRQAKAPVAQLSPLRVRVR